MNRQAFLESLGPLTQSQREGFEALLTAGEKLPREHMAYVLATAFHETSGLMQPIKETVMPWHQNKNPSDKEVISRLDRAFAAGKLPQVKVPYWRGGWFGRGYVQVTHQQNYHQVGKVIGIDLLSDPNRALHPNVAARILIDGMSLGLFTGKKLSDYLPADFVNARRIVNGTDRATEIAERALRYDVALKAAGYGHQQAKEPAKEPASGGIWAAIFAAIMSIFRRK